MLKNSRNILKFNSGVHAATNILGYVEPLLEFVEKSKSQEEHDTSLRLSEYIDHSKKVVMAQANQHAKG